VLGLHDPFAAGVAAGVTGNHADAGYHLEPIHVRLDRHGLEGPAPRNTVAVRIEPHRLVLVHLGRFRHERIESPRRQRQRGLAILFEQFADGLRLARHHMVPLGQGTRPQVRIQFGQVFYPGHGSGPVPLQVIHAVLHVGLLVAPCRHTEPWIKAVVARQGGVPRLHLALATFQDRGGHRRGIVPPDLPGHTAEELEPLDHPGQNRLRLLARQRHPEAIARVTPRQQQHRNLPPLLRKVHVDVTEVRLQPPARRMRQRDKRLALGPTDLADIAPDLVVAAQVALLISELAIELRRRVLLLTGGLLILRQDLLDPCLVRTQPRGRSLLLQRVRAGLALLQHLPDLSPGMVEPPGDLPNAHPVPMRNSDPAIIFHRQHPFFSVIRGPCQKALSLRRSLGWVHFRCRFLLPDVGPFYMPISIPAILKSSIQGGSVVLMLGAGASTEASDTLGRSAPSTKELVQLIADKFLGGKFKDLPLNQVAEIAASEADVVTEN